MKLRIALVTGGYSGEARISYESANTIQNNLDQQKFEVYRIDITREGWFYTNSKGEKDYVNKNDFSIHMNGYRILFDAALIAIHGTPGEDGKLQGYFDMMGIPYTSCNASVSALTFNKRFTIALASLSGINVSNSVVLYKEDSSKHDFLTEAKKLKFPVFVKPNNGGSSIGTSKVDKKEQLEEAVRIAMHEDSQIMVEEYIAGPEFTVGVYRHKGNIIPLPVTEIISKKDFFDFEAKYQGASNEVTPANIDHALKNLIQSQAVKIYKVFNCSGVVRIDFIYKISERKLYMLEINTIPGQTDASLIPQQIRSTGGNLKDFYTMLIEECLGKKKI